MMSVHRDGLRQERAKRIVAAGGLVAEPVRGDRRFLHYIRNLSTPRLILWCYAIWYSVMLVRYFDPSPRLWLTSLGLSAIIGFALWMSTAAGIPAGTRVDRWGIFRLFLMPFCVSSFAALVKGHGFFLIISPRTAENLAAVAFCAAIVTVVKLVQRRGSM